MLKNVASTGSLELPADNTGREIEQKVCSVCLFDFNKAALLKCFLCLIKKKRKKRKHNKGRWTTYRFAQPIGRSLMMTVCLIGPKQMYEVLRHLAVW